MLWLNVSCVSETSTWEEGGGKFSVSKAVFVDSTENSFPDRLKKKSIFFEERSKKEGVHLQLR